MYWEVTAIEQLAKEEHIPVALLKGLTSKKTFAGVFVPERPLIIEAL